MDTIKYWQNRVFYKQQKLKTLLSNKQRILIEKDIKKYREIIARKIEARFE